MTASRKQEEAAKTAARVLEPDVTVEDLRRKAEQVRDLAKAEVKRATETDLTKAVVVGAVALVVVVGFAYYLGTRRS